MVSYTYVTTDDFVRVVKCSNTTELFWAETEDAEPPENNDDEADSADDEQEKPDDRYVL